MFQSTNRLVYNMSWLRVCLQCRRHMFDPWIRMIPWRREWQHIPVFHPGELHGQRRLAGYSPWSHKELDMTEQLHIHTYICYLKPEQHFYFEAIINCASPDKRTLLYQKQKLNLLPTL